MKFKLVLLSLLIVFSFTFAVAQDEGTDASSAGEASEGVEDNANGSSMGMAFGAVTLDGKMYSQVALRPTLRMGKLGVGLDVVMYIDNEGNIYKGNWDEAKDILDKIYFLSWGVPQDPFFVRLGGLDNVSIAHGIALNHYTNMLEYPSVKRLGTRLNFKVSKFGVETFVSDWQELGGTIKTPGIVGGRLSFGEKINFGLSGVTDINPYGAFDKDRDGDNYSDLMDMFPDDGDIWKDSDMDGIADNYDFDSDGDNYWEYDPNAGYTPAELAFLDTVFQGKGYAGIDTNGVDTLSIPTLTNLDQNHPMVYSMSFDVSVPLVDSKAFVLEGYSIASILGYKSDSLKQTALGTVPLGFSARIGGFIDAKIEYRWAKEYFQYGFFGRNYDINRVHILQDSSGTNPQLLAKTKYDRMLENGRPASNGYFGELGITLFNTLRAYGSYMNMKVEGADNIKTFHAGATITEGLIPKLAEATAYYERDNEANPFDFKNPSENTVLGYRVGIKIAEGTNLYWHFMQTYRDKNGDGNIDSDKEAVKVMKIETSFAF
ncbi:MAG: hypothetical protein U9N76_08195 [Candidatus Marinimicrobia bacterium]|nr:hypothetical protein [Candidatus Neomarinimicrobiota bacterium]